MKTTTKHAFKRILEYPTLAEEVKMSKGTKIEVLPPGEALNAANAESWSPSKELRSKFNVKGE